MFNRFIQSWILSVIILAVLGFLVSSIIQKRQSASELDKTITHLDSKISELEDSEAQNEDLGDFFQSDTYLELQARERLNYKKEGEKVVIVYREEGDIIDSASSPSATGVYKDDLKNWQKWWKFVTGN